MLMIKIRVNRFELINVLNLNFLLKKLKEANRVEFEGETKEDFSWPLRAAAAEGQFPFLGEGVAVGRGRGLCKGRKAVAFTRNRMLFHKEL